MSFSKTALIVLLTLLSIAPSEAADKQTPDERALDAARAQANGILVGQPKVYDDSLLQQMLNAAQARLAALQIIDQSGIASRLGSLTGASQTINSFGLSVQGPSVPQIATTNNGATSSTVSGSQNSTTQGTASNTQTTTNAPITNVVATSPQMNPPTVTAPAPTVSLPSSFSVSASDILNEQMQLTYEIANLRLLLEGSLNDRILVYRSNSGETSKIVKPRVTLGFPITLLPDKRHEHAIAVVEIEIEKVTCPNPAAVCDGSLNGDPPAVVALLPREKTYNVASITDNSLSIAGGMVTQVIGVSGSFMRAKKTFYMVQDQDTVALTFQPTDPHRVGFLWEFRPVLGAKLVHEGLKQTFVQIALPSTWSADPLGTVHVRTYWRDYDSGKNLVKGVRSHTLTGEKIYSIPNLPLDQTPKVFDSASLEDLGNGQVLVNLFGRFLGGTYIRVGPNLLRDSAPGFSFEYQRIRFVASISDLATKGAVLVARDGTETPLLLFKDEVNNHHLEISTTNVRPLDDANSRISVRVQGIVPEVHLPLLLIIGGKTFGYSDAPLDQNGDVFSAVVPTSFLASNPVLFVASLFTDRRYWSRPKPIADMVGGSVLPKLVVLEATADSAKFLLYGAQLDSQAKVLSPTNGKLDPFGGTASPELQTITLTKEQVKTQKQIVVQKADGFIFQVSVPSVDLPDATKPLVTPVQPVKVGTDEAAFKGEGLTTLEKVVFNGIELKLRKQPDGKIIWLKGLKTAGVTAEVKKQSLDFYFKSGKQTVMVNVIAP